ncbi:STAS domain-containing protein [Sphaerisporangium dianthi]|uniref:Anti-sigma factor antagonist n=1 Tax=Sphaerisporangium dianthi TaxID=1436120 RepID=A0ABV9CQ27_9ACTN
MDALRLSTVRCGGTVTVTVAGELDIATTDRLRAHVAHALAEARWSRLVLDVSGVSFIGAAGLGVLIALQRLARTQHTALYLSGVTPSLHRLLRVTRLEEHFQHAGP